MSRKDCMKMEQMTEDEIKRKLEDIRKEWSEKDVDETRKAKQKQMLVCGNLELLKQYQEQYPEGYEKYYWDTYRCLEQDNVWVDANVGIITSISMTLSALSLAISGEFSGILGLLRIILGLIIAVFSIKVILPYVRSCFNTREHSYYRIFVAMMTDLKNAGKVPEMNGTEIADTKKDKEEVKSGKKGNK